MLGRVGHDRQADKHRDGRTHPPTHTYIHTYRMAIDWSRGRPRNNAILILSDINLLPLDTTSHRRLTKPFTLSPRRHTHTHTHSSHVSYFWHIPRPATHAPLRPFMSPGYLLHASYTLHKTPPRVCNVSHVTPHLAHGSHATHLAYPSTRLLPHKMPPVASPTQTPPAPCTSLPHGFHSCHVTLFIAAAEY